MQALRLFHTLRHLKAEQTFGRLAYRLARPRARLGPAPSPRPLAGRWTAPVERPPCLLAPDRVLLLNREGRLDTPAAWNDPDQPKLWLYNLHYFDDLAAGGGDQRQVLQRNLVARWIAENPPGAGNGWEPYPLSLRLVNWIKWLLSGQPAEADWLHSLAIQARWLERRLEWHLLGNHLLANAKALVFCGLFFEGSEAERWLARGLSIYRRELGAQVLADGGHFERSPMYHALILEDLLDLVNLADAYGRPVAGEDLRWREAIGPMRRWLAAMTHPDGRIAFFNDAAFGVAAEPAALDAYAERLGLPPVPAVADGVTDLAASGYIRVQSGRDVLIFDAAPVGPDYLPGHAHADTLSMELSVDGERVVVNGGTSTYSPGPQRALERSTAAHSTVEVDGRNSSEVWAVFRVGRRARIVERSLADGTAGFEVAAAHDGYRVLSGRPRHRRLLQMSPGRLIVEDVLEGGWTCAVARFHLGQGIRVQSDAAGREGVLITETGRKVGWRTSAPASVEVSRWRPEFGVEVETSCLAVGFQSARVQTVFDW